MQASDSINSQDYLQFSLSIFPIAETEKIWKRDPCLEQGIYMYI